MAILRDPQGKEHELEFYDIQGLAERLVGAMDNETLKDYFETNFKDKMTRVSPEFEFLIHKLGWMLKDPFNTGEDEYLFSNGSRAYIVSDDYINQEGFDRFAVQDDTVGFPILTDEALGYVPAPVKIGYVGTGILDEKGYVSASVISDPELLAQVLMMHEMINNKELYEEYTSEETEELYDSVEEYLKARPNIVATKKEANGKISLNYVSENTGTVKDTLDALAAEGLIEVGQIVEEPTKGVMVA